MKTVKAKFHCTSIEDTEWNKNVKMQAVVGNNGENKDFNDATPYGELIIGIHGDVPAATFFEVGEDYYMDFTKSPKE